MDNTNNGSVKMPSQPAIKTNYLSAEQIIVKMIIDSQDNINRLIAAQERLIDIQQQQTIYIDTLLSKIGNQNNNDSGATDKKENNNEKQQPTTITNNQPINP